MFFTHAEVAAAAAAAAAAVGGAAHWAHESRMFSGRNGLTF